jgi:anti-sigma regulatory factor (Ser/Thr protein kinase)/ActR/RegA family two-component response regulator
VDSAPGSNPIRASRPATARRILVAGGDGELRHELLNARTLQGYDLDLCEGNAAALRSLRRRACDVIITDPATSVAEDLAFVRELARFRPGVKTIILADQATPEDVIAALRAHVFACFSRPYDYREIFDMARRATLETDWHDGIEVVSGMRDWITLRVNCRLISAERLTRFMTEHRSDLGSGERDMLMMAFREVLINAMEHGAGFDAEKVVEVTAARTAKAIIYHFRDPGQGFRRDALGHAAVAHDDSLSHMSVRAEEGLRPGGFGMLLVKQIVDELIYNERGNEVLMIKHLP